MKNAVILYGPPASGKDTVTRALTAGNGRYVQYRRLKVGPGRTCGYQMTTDAELDRRRAHGTLLYENNRYDSTYAVDSADLRDIVESGKVPVLHIGQTDGIMAISKLAGFDWLVVALWCSRGEAAQRLAERDDNRIEERLVAWDATLSDFRSADPCLFDVVINSSTIGADRTAEVIETCSLL